ncbi:Hypothetical_protein [Hexamita inflata]|uniref:Hypothetical_protein n=1 Tax=Hexamita inflata TaxID=28002 RepID=A0AA86RIK0_9EUKA|nr:Hypothetical protein HINF_LOCUS66200 [Hexamita inflata]
MLNILQQENVKTLLEGSDVLYQNKTKMSPIFNSELLFPPTQKLLAHTLNLLQQRKNAKEISHFLETAQTDFIETFESKTQALARQCFHFQNGLNPSFMPTQQRPNRALTVSLADQFHLIHQLNFQKLVLASQFQFARYFLRLQFNLEC